MGASFTSFEKFGDMLATMPEEDGRELSYAVMMYGHLGVEPDLPYPLSTMFAAVREDIDNSKNAREQGRRGGRPRRKDAETPGSAKAETTGSSDTETPGFANVETPGSADTETPGSAKAETQTKPSQANTGQAKGGVKRARFTAPTPAEVRAYAEEYASDRGLDPGGFSAEGFTDYYAANGWKVGRNPMRDWRAAVRNWMGKDCRKGERSEYSDF